MSSQETSHQLLGLTPGASLAEIKKAYRARAMQLHPDRNKQPGAQEQFIALTEAYLSLVRLKSGAPIRKTIYRKPAPAPPSREELRRKARKAAQMQYEDWLKSEEDKEGSALTLFAQYMNLVLFSFFILYLAFVCLDKGYTAPCIALFALVAILNIVAFRNNVKEFTAALRVALKNDLAVGVMCTLFNILLFLFIGLRTMLPLSTLFLAYAVPALISLAFIPKNTALHKGVIAAFAVPFAVNLLLTLNFFVSFPAQTETYSFTTDSNERGIVLEKEAYRDSPGIRLFWDEEALKVHSHIRYTFRTGIFGIRVLSHYELLLPKDL